MNLRKSTEKANKQSGTIGKKKEKSERHQKVQARAKYLCLTNEGELRNSIRTSVKQTKGQTEAVCYTNKPYATYVEFGTGPVGQRKHSGISPEVTPVYKQRGWAFPANAIASGAYQFAETTYHGQKYFLTAGQAAQPFMYPALKDGAEEAVQAIVNSKTTIGDNLK